jgi:hypothetical protein
MRRYKYILTLVLTGLVLILTACKESDGSTKASAVFEVDSWTIQIRRWESAKQLNTTRTVEHYNGNIGFIPQEEKPREGFVFLLVELVLEKKNSGPSVFFWERLFIEDGKTNRYVRLSNDTFIETYGFHRIKAVSLNFGKCEGYACFEIPESEAKNQLTLVYEGTERVIRIPFKP